MTISEAEIDALITAIKFAYPEYGINRVFREIKNKGEEYKNVPLHVVRKRMQVLKFTARPDIENQEDPIQISTILGHNSDKTILPEDKKVESVGRIVQIPLDVPIEKDVTKYTYQATVHTTMAKKGKSGGIYKIQVAAGAALTDSPMFLYNQSRTRQTYIHPMTEGFFALRDTIVEKGMHGNHGKIGGMKHFFRGQYDASQDVLLIHLDVDVIKQNW